MQFRYVISVNKRDILEYYNFLKIISIGILFFFKIIFYFEIVKYEIYVYCFRI